jgi:hypothetical protein
VYMKTSHYFNSDEARQRVLHLYYIRPIRVQIIKRPCSVFNEYCSLNGIVIDIQRFTCIWVRLEGASPRRARILKLPFDHVRIIV